eukprot:1555697-Rhodomonas_salina.1
MSLARHDHVSPENGHTMPVIPHTNLKAGPGAHQPRLGLVVRAVLVEHPPPAEPQLRRRYGPPATTQRPRQVTCGHVLRRAQRSPRTGRVQVGPGPELASQCGQTGRRWPRSGRRGPGSGRCRLTRD